MSGLVESKWRHRSRAPPEEEQQLQTVASKHDLRCKLNKKFKQIGDTEYACVHILCRLYYRL